jgi:hypothetical protein
MNKSKAFVILSLVATLLSIYVNISLIRKQNERPA